MIPNQSESNLVETNIDYSKAIKFQIDPNEYMFKLVRKQIYGQPAWSTIREILTNSIDAMKSVGKGHIPITIIEGDPTVVIDNGPGMNFELMVNIFAWYGRSTKRDSNNQEGMFGVGAKSPFSISDQFTIETVIEKDGVHLKQIYLLSEDHSKCGAIIPIFNEENEYSHDVEVDGKVYRAHYLKVDEPTGTKVKIPIQKQYEKEVRHSIIAHSNFLPTRPIVAWQGSNVEWVDPLETAEGWYIYDGNKLRQLIPNYSFNTIYNSIPYHIVMDYDCVPISDFFFKLSTGSIELNASREQVVEKRELKTQLKAVYNKYKEESRKKLTDQLEKCVNVDEVLETFKNNFTYIKFFDEWTHTFNYKGDKVSLRTHEVKEIKRNSAHYKTKISIDKWSNGLYLPSIKKEQLIIVDNPEKLRNITIRRKIIQYMDDKGYKQVAVFHRFSDVENKVPQTYNKFWDELRGIAFDVSTIKLVYSKSSSPTSPKKPKHICNISTGPSKFDNKEVDLTKGEFVYKMYKKGVKIGRYDYPRLNFDSVKSTAFYENSQLHKKIKGLPNWFQPREFFEHYKTTKGLKKEEIELGVSHLSCTYENDIVKEELGVDAKSIKKVEPHIPVIEFAIRENFLGKTDLQKVKEKIWKKYPLLRWVSVGADSIKHIKKYRELIDAETKP